MAISKDMPWGTEIEIMPGKRHMFHNAKNYDGIFLGWVKYPNTKSIIVIRRGNKTSQSWSQGLWRQKTK